MLSPDVSNSFESEQEPLECYEASVSGEAYGFGFNGKGSVGVGGCTEEAANSFKAGRNKFLQEVREQTVVGGRKACATCEDFVVESQDSTLLTTKDEYQPGDSQGVNFRLLSVRSPRAHPLCLLRSRRSIINRYNRTQAGLHFFQEGKPSCLCLGSMPQLSFQLEQW